MTQYKQCRECLTNYPATKVFFYGNKKTNDRLDRECKQCADFKHDLYPSRNKKPTEAEVYGQTWLNGNDEIYA